MASTDVTKLVVNVLQSENDDLLKTMICCDLAKKLQSCDFLVGQEFSMYWDFDVETYSSVCQSRFWKETLYCFKVSGNYL